MKKNLFFHFSVLAMLIVLISACSSKKPEYTNVIPSDASQVIAVNLKSLADKAGTKDKETKEALQKLTDALKSDMNTATFQQLEAVLKVTVLHKSTSGHCSLSLLPRLWW